MQDIKERFRCLAALAVFRELYDSKKDIFGVISEFLNGIITENNKYSFNSTEITNLLNKTFDFDIPEAVVRTALNRLNYLKKERGEYFVNKDLKKNKNDIATFQEKTETSNNILISPLFSFIRQEKNIKLSDDEKKEIVCSFCSLLMDNFDSGKYSEYISGFILKNKEDKKFRSELNTIREGVILYSGLKYNSNLGEIGSWKTGLTIYLDTEILFDFFGYNGVLYTELFQDFFHYVNEINNIAKKKLIKLSYFREVKNEIEGFFSKAEAIVAGKDILNPKMIAMSSIVEGCKKLSDVMDKKSDFFASLTTSGIIEDKTTTYFDEGNYKHNIADQNTIKAISDEYGFDITEHLRYLNYIHIHRGGTGVNDFYNVGCIFLTGTSKTIKVANHSTIKPETMVPLAVTLYWITSKLWFKLNKGFGVDSFPRSFDVITKAQIILSSVLNDSVGRGYDDLKIRFENGTITENQAKARIINLKNQARKPEDIIVGDISSILDAISGDSLEKFKQDQEHFKNNAEEQAEENIKLKKDISQKKEELDEYKQNKSILASQVAEGKKLLLQEKKNSIEILEKQKKLIDIEIRNAFWWFKIKFLGSIVLFYALLCFLIWFYGWDTFEQWSWLIGVALPAVVALIYMLFKEKTINPLEVLKRKKQKISEEKYHRFNFDSTLLEKLKLEEMNTVK